ncbi:MAG: L-histidine N(alpha)-methyltransferase, partial [Rhodothermales bacterium]|nr:L-histidine N(alpha)-methyltransferase [Rhodothermales bacterium]
MTPTATEDPPLLDYHPEPASFLDDVREGLQAPQKSLPSKYFYDARGSHLFDEITRLPEYYPTRTEVGILRSRIGEIAQRIGPRCLLVEYGSGSSAKTHILLDALPDLAGYVPIDIARDHLLDAARRLAETYPGLRILPVCADYTTAFTLPHVDGARPVVFFPGS